MADCFWKDDPISALQVAVADNPVVESVRFVQGQAAGAQQTVACFVLPFDLCNARTKGDGFEGLKEREIFCGGCL